MIMANSDFNKFRVDDARITKLVLDGATLFVSIRDWQERTMQLVFVDVIGIQGFGIVNVDLGGASESSSDPMIQKACSSVDEPVAGFQCYSLFSAWNDQPLIRVVARSWNTDDAAILTTSCSP
jgi:hypothetical protein